MIRNLVITIYIHFCKLVHKRLRETHLSVLYLWFLLFIFFWEVATWNYSSKLVFYLLWQKSLKNEFAGCKLTTFNSFTIFSCILSRFDITAFYMLRFWESFFTVGNVTAIFKLVWNTQKSTSAIIFNYQGKMFHNIENVLLS